MREAILLTDGYKLDHRRQYPEGTEYVYSNWTPRSNKYFPEAGELVALDQVDKDAEDRGELLTVFQDGKLLKDWTLNEIRTNIDKSITV